MDGQDWSEFQQELEENLISPDAMFYRDIYNYIPVQHLCKIDDSPQNLFPISGDSDWEAASWNPNTNTPKNPATENQICMKRKRDDDFRGVVQNPKRPVLEKKPTNINFSSSAEGAAAAEPDVEAIAHMKEIIYQAAAFRPVDFGDGKTEMRAKRKNVRISSDPQTVAARERRERISERIRALQRLVPGGSKMDTASMLDEAANYLKFLRSQVKALEALGGPAQGPNYDYGDVGFGYSGMQGSGFSVQGPNPVGKPESC